MLPSALAERTNAGRNARTPSLAIGARGVLALISFRCELALRQGTRIANSSTQCLEADGKDLQNEGQGDQIDRRDGEAARFGRFVVKTRIPIGQKRFASGSLLPISAETLY